MARVKRDAAEPPVPEKILTASMKVFGAVGYESASMKAIAKESGVTPAALYYHYKDKRDLLAQGLVALAKAVVAAVRIEAVDIEADPRRALERFVRTYITYQITNIRAVAPMYSSLVHGVHHKRNVLTDRQMRTIREIERQSLETIRDILDAGRRQGHFAVESTTLTAFAIIGMCEHTLAWVDPKGRANVRDIARYFSGLALRMVSPASGS